MSWNNLEKIKRELIPKLNLKKEIFLDVIKNDLFIVGVEKISDIFTKENFLLILMELKNNMKNNTLDENGIELLNMLQRYYNEWKKDEIKLEYEKHALLQELKTPSVKQEKEISKDSRKKSDSLIKSSENQNSITESSGNYFISSPQTGEPVQITPQEKETIWKNPEARENFFHFIQILKDINMEVFGEMSLRTKIFQSLWWIWFKYNDADYLGINEIKIFLWAILHSIETELWRSIPGQNLSFPDYIGKLKILNKQGILSWKKDENILWESYIEKVFKDKFIPRNSGVSNFNIASFQESIKK